MPRNKENESSIPIHIRTNIKSIKKKALKRNQYPDGTKEKVKKDKVIKQNLKQLKCQNQQMYHKVSLQNQPKKPIAE